MAVNKLRPRLPASEWRITVVDRDDDHHDQPGYLFVPLGVYGRADVVKPRSRYSPEGAEALRGALAGFDGGRLIARVSELPVKCPVARLSAGDPHPTTGQPAPEQFAALCREATRPLPHGAMAHGDLRPPARLPRPRRRRAPAPGRGLRGGHADPPHHSPVRRHARPLRGDRERHPHGRPRAPRDWLDALAPFGTDAHKPFLEAAPWLIAIVAQVHGVRAVAARVGRRQPPPARGDVPPSHPTRPGPSLPLRPARTPARPEDPVKHLLVLGAGTAGTMVVNRLRPRLPASDWRITVVDRDDEHHYQPGYLFVPFGTVGRDDVVRRRSRFIPEGVELVFGEIAELDPVACRVTLEDGTALAYDQLVIATGTAPRPDLTPGMLGAEWRQRVHEVYTLDGAEALAGALAAFDGGRLVAHVCEMPVTCPVAPLEFLFLADAHFRERGLRERVELVYVTPLDGTFTTPVAAARLGHLLERRGIAVESDFVVERIDDAAKALVSYDERTVPFDLLVTVHVNAGADFVGRSGLGDELNHVGGRPLTHACDGHVNCFVASGDGQTLLLDFDYQTQPLPGRYPLPGIGRFTLLEETAMNHAGKLMFKWLYWHALLRGHDLPFPSAMSLAGKVREVAP